MEHLALEIFDLPTKETPRPTGSQFATLGDNASITIVDTSEIFASGDVWSFSFTLNIPANAHIFGSAGEIHGSRLHDVIHKRRARLWADRLPLYTGYIKIGDEVDVDDNGNVDITFQSGTKTFENLIEGGKANQVPLMSDVRIGVALWRKRWTWNGIRIGATPKLKDIDDRLYYPEIGTSPVTHTLDPEVVGDENPEVSVFVDDGEEEGSSVPDYPRMVYPKGYFQNVKTGEMESVDCINTDTPYDDGHPFCNVALCYQKYGYKKKNERGEIFDDYNSTPEAEREYEYMPANRINSAPNFFVIYWLRCLMQHIGIYIEENQMMNVDDLRRLFFVNTNTDYKVPKTVRKPEVNPKFPNIGKYKFSTTHLPEDHPRNRYEFHNSGDDTFGIELLDYTVGAPHGDANWPEDVPFPNIENILISISKEVLWPISVFREYMNQNDYLHDAYATSECFPNADVSEVVKALESGFGIRFLFSADYKRVRIVLLRNILSGTEIQDITCDILSETKVENNIRGFRMTYGGNTEDTHFYYKGFADMLPHKKQLWVDDSDKHDYSHWDLDSQYKDLLNKVTAFNKTCYVTPVNGNAYGIKVDQDAKRYDELHPSLFEFAGFMDAEDGDCSGEEDTIETVNVGFTPAIMNDLNMNEERGGKDTPPVYEQRFALFVNEKMRPRRPQLSGYGDNNDPEMLYSIDVMYDRNRDKVDKDGVVAPGSFFPVSDLYIKSKPLQLHAQLTAGFYYFYQGPQWTSAYWDVDMTVQGHIPEEYRLYLQDNFEPNDDGIAPIETHDWGLTLGIMRGSGSDARVDYNPDWEDGEGNDTWGIVPGSKTTVHPDTCDSYGNEWDYGSEVCIDTHASAGGYIAEHWTRSNYDLLSRHYDTGVTDEDSDLKYYFTMSVRDSEGSIRQVLLGYTPTYYTYDWYVKTELEGKTVEEMYERDAELRKVVIEIDSTEERRKTLADLRNIYFYKSLKPIYVNNGVSTLYDRFSLKLRAEKPNPKFDPKKSEDEQQEPRYLNIEEERLRKRGLCDQFYKEYSYFIRNARIAKMEVKMELAQLMSIDKTKKVRIGEVTGFVRKMQYSISNQTGLGMVTLEIMYI